MHTHAPPSQPKSLNQSANRTWIQWTDQHATRSQQEKKNLNSTLLSNQHTQSPMRMFVMDYRNYNADFIAIVSNTEREWDAYCVQLVSPNGKSPETLWNNRKAFNCCFRKVLCSESPLCCGWHHLGCVCVYIMHTWAHALSICFRNSPDSGALHGMSFLYYWIGFDVFFTLKLKFQACLVVHACPYDVHVLLSWRCFVGNR